MKPTLARALMVLLLIFTDRVWSQQAQVRVAFFGNSQTIWNNLPNLVAKLASAGGMPILTAEGTMLGVTLEHLWYMHPTPMILKGKWDFIVLQEHRASTVGTPDRMRESVLRFDEAARKSGAKTVLFAPIPRDGRRSEQTAMAATYAKIGAEIGAAVAPVGAAVQAATEGDPNLRMYDADNQHPSPLGSYVAACAIYLTISSKDTCPRVALPNVNAQAARLAAERATAEWRAQARKK
jgi:hypothetical protein